MKTVTIILPAYNEESSFELLKERMGQVLKQNPDYNWEFLLVNDGSSDHTLQQMMRLHREWRHKYRKQRSVKEIVAILWIDDIEGHLLPGMLERMVEDGVVQIELTLEPDTQPGYQCHDKPYQKHRPEI